MNDTAMLTRPSSARPWRGGRPVFVQRYWAFLSYSHKDAETADWLHNALERFRVPKAMVGRGTRYGIVPSRLAPVFRDQHDLAAGDDLREDIQDALASSRFLIVLCSPAAVASRWVDGEIRLFKRLRPDGEVLAAIIDGEPWACDMPGREAEECFPPALKEEFDEAGEPTGERAEPIAADLRPERDGRQLGLQKLIAGMLDVGLDDLVQRDAHRRQRRMLALTAASVAGMVVTSGLAVMAVQARDEARDQRREAEGLISFMLGDLRDRLEPIGKLDALDVVGARALAYYQKQDKDSLSDSSLAQRAKALTMMGDIAQQRGDLDSALGRYREAAETTSELLRRHPDEPQRMFDHAQNLFYFGAVAWQRGQLDQAVESFRQYKQLAGRMIALEPGRTEWRLEGIYADQNLGMALIAQRQFEQANTILERNLVAIERLWSSEPKNAEYQYQYLEALAYLADAQAGMSRLREAVGTRERMLALLSRFQLARPDDMAFSRKEVRAEQALSSLLLDLGDTPAALRHSDRAVAVGEQLAATDPDNFEWIDRTAAAYITASRVNLAANRVDAADAMAQSGCSLVSRLIAREPTVVAWSETLMRQCLLSRAAIALRRRDVPTILTLAGQVSANVQGGQAANASAYRDLSQAQFLAGEGLQVQGRNEEAARTWAAALRRLSSTGSVAVDDLALRALLLHRLGRNSEAMASAARAKSAGYRDPAFVAGMQGGT